MPGKKVLVGMSGGVDSSVSAALLVREGYEVVGGFIKNWSDSKDLWTGECAWRGERRDAMRVAAKLGIPLLTFDFEEAYRERVVSELFRGYGAGQTPNPDVLCNEAIKFGLFLDEAKRLGFDFVATGHYARVQHEADVSHLLRGLDPNKDQSYFLYRVPQEALRMTLFPVGELLKPDVRKIAEEMELPVAQKPDSQGICFIGKLDMEEFLRKKIPSVPGEIVDENGNVLGTHSGLDAYTIGQREGLLVSLGGEPWFVAGKDREKNRLMIVQGADNPKLYRSSCSAGDLRWTRGEFPELPMEVEVQVRYRQEPVKATVGIGRGAVAAPSDRSDEPGRGNPAPTEIVLSFHSPVKAIAPGQSAVLYVGDECLGGGVILEENG
ncbi:MAG: tRNA 2-thiouridine(34) synthase MnmA [Patescibacteria group bacterium]